MKYLPLLTLVILLTPTIAFGATEQYQPLVGIPGVTDTGDALSFDKLVNALYALSISIAALLAVIKIVIAGIKWMTTDIISSKGAAKKDIQGALLGLLVVLAAVLIITVINPDILKNNLNLSKSGPVSKAAVVPSTLSVTPSDMGAYTSLERDVGAVQLSIFKKGCKDDGGVSMWNSDGSKFRCYRDVAPTQTIAIYDNVCTLSTVTGDCPAAYIDTATAIADCMNNAGASYVEDPEFIPKLSKTPKNVGGIICKYTPG